MKKRIFVGKSENPMLVHESSLLCEAKSKIILVDTHNTDVTIHLKNNAEVYYICLQKSGNKKAIVEKNATIHWIELYTSSVKTQTITTLNGIGAHTTATVLFAGNTREKFTLHHQVEHHAKKTTSDIVFFGTLDHAHADTSAKTIIQQTATGAIAHQKLKTILLDESAKASAVPEMNIKNYDVQATHTASVGHIKPELLFYMTTRGIPEEEAKKHIMHGQFTALLASCNLDVQALLMNALAKKIGEPHV